MKDFNLGRRELSLEDGKIPVSRIYQIEDGKEYLQAECKTYSDYIIFTTYYPSGNIETLSFFDRKGRFHRNGGPATLHVQDNGFMISKEYYQYGDLHNDFGPAKVEYHKNGTECLEEYYLFNMLHNANGPAHIEYDEKGHTSVELYYRKGILRNPNGADTVLYLKNEK